MQSKSISTHSRELQISSRGPVRIRLLGGDEHGQLLEFAIDYEKAEVPDRAYYADYCDVARGRFGYDLIFGRLVPGEPPRLRTKIEVAFPRDMFLKQLWGSSREFHKT